MPNSLKKHTIVGNGKNVTGKTVTELTVVGNNNKIDVARNQGKVEVIGNHCRLNIRQNLGDVVLVGNHGIVNLWSPATKERVNCTGEGCRINVIKASMNESECNTKMFASSAPTTTLLLNDGFDLTKAISLSDLFKLGGLSRKTRST